MTFDLHDALSIIGGAGILVVLGFMFGPLWSLLVLFLALFLVGVFGGGFRK